MKNKPILISCILLLIILVSSCKSEPVVVHTPVFQEITGTPKIIPSTTPPGSLISTTPPVQERYTLTVTEGVPLFYQNEFDALSLSSSQPISLLVCGESPTERIWQGEYVFSAAVQFPTVDDEISYEALKQLWNGQIDEDGNFKELIIPKEHKEIFTYLWGDFNPSQVKLVSEEKVSEVLWEQKDRVALIPFESIEPRLKVLSVGGQNPMRNSFEIHQYSLSFQVCLAGDIDSEMMEGVLMVPTSNRDPSKITAILMTGVTALTRETAYKMEMNGILYPAEEIKDWFDQADIVHISNEVPFTEECLVREPPLSGSRFCSRPDYFELLEYIGANVIEITGNHLLDYGDDAFQEMVVMFKAKDIEYFGGGANATDASRSLSLTHHGNEFEFFGCNVPGPDSVFATKDQGGANPCDLDELVFQVQNTIADEKIPIVTFQHYEACLVEPMSAQKADMVQVAEAGAVIVSGSQAHCPQSMTFVEDSFVHYGLGNLFFDQMWDSYRNSFLDYHVFYNGQYLGVQLLTTRLEDASQPRPMTGEERALFLKKIFSQCDWGLE